MICMLIANVGIESSSVTIFCNMPPQRCYIDSHCQSQTIFSKLVKLTTEFRTRRRCPFAHFVKNADKTICLACQCIAYLYSYLNRSTRNYLIMWIFTCLCFTFTIHFLYRQEPYFLSRFRFRSFRKILSTWWAIFYSVFF